MTRNPETTEAAREAGWCGSFDAHGPHDGCWGTHDHLRVESEDGIERQVVGCPHRFCAVLAVSPAVTGREVVHALMMRDGERLPLCGAEQPVHRWAALTANPAEVTCLDCDPRTTPETAEEAKCGHGCRLSHDQAGCAWCPECHPEVPEWN